MVFKVLFMGAVILSLPNWANGFNLPSVPSGVSTILESRKLLKTGSDKIASFNFIFLTFNNSVRKFLGTKEFPLGTLVPAPESFTFGNEVPDGEEIKLA